MLALTLIMTEIIKNYSNWYIVELIERSEHIDSDKSNPNRRCLTWINNILIKAKSPSEAYDKSITIGKKLYTQRYKAAAGNIVHWKFVGIANLLPIFDDIKDGNEISWNDLGYISARRSDNMVLSKREFLKDIKFNKMG